MLRHFFDAQRDAIDKGKSTSHSDPNSFYSRLYEYKIVRLAVVASFFATELRRKKF
jgi:hypothetical protein